MRILISFRFFFKQTKVCFVLSASRFAVSNFLSICFFLRVLREKQILQKKKNTNKMFGGLPTPTETEAPDNVLTSGPASTTTSVDYHHHHHHDHPDCDGSPGSHEDHSGHLTTSQSAHITLR